MTNEELRVELMAAMRHLNVSRANWIMCRLHPGVNYTGCSKGRMVTALIERPPFAGFEYAIACFRGQESDKGVTTLRPQDVPFIAKRIAERNQQLDRVRARRAKNPTFIGLDNEIHTLEWQNGQDIRALGRVEVK